MTNSQLDWYLEWIATSILIVGTAFTSLGYYPQGPMLSCVGGVIWFIISVRWKKTSLMVVNGVMTLTGIAGLTWRYFS